MSKFKDRFHLTPEQSLFLAKDGTPLHIAIPQWEYLT